MYTGYRQLDGTSELHYTLLCEHHWQLEGMSHLSLSLSSVVVPINSHGETCVVEGPMTCARATDSWTEQANFILLCYVHITGSWRE